MYIFPKRCEGADELKYIFPSKQRAVQKAIELARPFYTEIPSEVDVIHYNDIHSESFKNEVDKGVCVYAGQEKKYAAAKNIYCGLSERLKHEISLIQSIE